MGAGHSSDVLVGAAPSETLRTWPIPGLPGQEAGPCELRPQELALQVVLGSMTSWGRSLGLRGPTSFLDKKLKACVWTPWLRSVSVVW